MYLVNTLQSQGLEPRFQDYEINFKVPLQDRPWARASGGRPTASHALRYCHGAGTKHQQGGQHGETPAHKLLSHVPAGLELLPSVRMVSLHPGQYALLLLLETQPRKH